MDSRAVKILFDTYWSGAGWKKDCQTDAADLEYAIRAGVMFPPIRVGHDALIHNVTRLVAKLDRVKVSRAFLASLSTRQLNWRSALGSYSFSKNLPPHSFKGTKEWCAVCGMFSGPDEDEDLNVLNFERLKWGGVRHTQPLYAWFDLSQLERLEVPDPTSEDETILRGILEAARRAPGETTSPALQKLFPKTLKSSKSEREVLIDILGLCGILETSRHPGFLRHYTPWSDREVPPQRFVERAYPVCWWRGKDGVNEAAVKHLFPSL
jgi:hypothetical protein